MRAYVILRTTDGSRRELVHGDFIGRLRSAAMCLDDARISEAHAMVSLRERELRLIALRGGLAVDGRPVNEVALQAGQTVLLARGVGVQVEEVHLPSSVLGLEGRELPRQVLPPVASLITEGRLRVEAGYDDRAAAWVWSSGGSWRLRVGAAPTRDLAPGDRVELGAHELHAVAIPLEVAGQVPTRADGGVDAPLHIHANFDTVQIHRERGAALVLGGIQARCVSELVALDGPAHWTVLAGLLWPDAAPESVRKRFDVMLSRLRRKLRDARVRTDLVHTDGAGQVELLLYPHDVIEDRT